jgi:hypothetical protein
MGHIDELSRVDGGWQSILARLEPSAAEIAELEGAFGHAHERRLGLRVPTTCWALLSGRTTSVYAVAVELSPTGVVLKFVGQRTRLLFRTSQRFTLDLFVPGASVPVHVLVRPARTIGDLQAFEFMQSSAVDRLTLAEYLDRLMGNHSLSTAPQFARKKAS